MRGMQGVTNGGVLEVRREIQVILCGAPGRCHTHGPGSLTKQVSLIFRRLLVFPFVQGIRLDFAG